MLNIKAVLIMLAVGQIVSIGFALDEDTYSQEFSSKTATDDQSGILVPSPWEVAQNESEYTSSEMAPSEVLINPPGSSEELYRTFDFASSIDSYQIVHWLGGAEHDFINCFWNGEFVARLIFDPDMGYSGYVRRTKVGIDLIFPASRYNDIVQTLRNEKRIAIGYKQLDPNRRLGAIISGPSQIGG